MTAYLAELFFLFTGKPVNHEHLEKSFLLCYYGLKMMSSAKRAMTDLVS